MILDQTKKYHCWFMYENHTFSPCEGNIYSIKNQLLQLFTKNPYGSWSRLMLMEDYKKEPDNNDLQIVTTLQFDLSYFDDLEGVSLESLSKNELLGLIKNNLPKTLTSNHPCYCVGCDKGLKNKLNTIVYAYMCDTCDE